MRFDVRHAPSYSIAYAHMEVGELLRVESGALVAMSQSIKVDVDMGPGGLVKGLMRKAIVGEGLFMSRYRSQAHGAWVSFAPKFPGDIAIVTMGAEHSSGIVAEAGSLLALTEHVSADPRFAGLQMVALREGATMLRLRGEGQVVLAAYGGIEAFDLGAGETLIFDSGHVVAYSEGMAVRVGPLSSLLTASLSGEGLVAEVTGPGRVWTQTRSIVDVGHWLFPSKHPAKPGARR